jgi:uncharacterized protein
MSLSPSSKDHPTVSSDFFEAEQTAGSLLRPDGERCAALSLEFIKRLHTAVIEQFGDAAQDILYRTGFECGLREMLGLHQYLQSDSGAVKQDLWQLDANFVLESWWKRLQEAGWGAAKFDCSRLQRGVVIVELQNSAVAAALDATKKPACHYYAGLLAAALSFYDRAERHATEIQCRAMGQPLCIFLIGPGADVDAAETARKQNASAADVIRRLG